MKIVIEYESSWRNSFLDGSNNEPLPKKGRKFIASMTSLKKPENYFFNDLEAVITFDDIEKKQVITQEMTYIRNITGSTDQGSFTGMIKANDVMFSADYAAEFWGVLALDFDAVCQFIIQNNKSHADIGLDPLTIIARLEALNKEKPVINEGGANEAMAVLHQYFPEISYINKKDKIIPISIYCSALYLQLTRLSKRFTMDSAKTKAGGISGISKRGFTKKDFMGRFTTGEKKKIWGNPYIRKERIKGEGEVISLMTKASGQLEVNIDVNRTKGREIKKMIENAGVSSFYMGKKGLAYVSTMRV